MEEADEILLFALRQSGAPIDDGVKSFGDFGAEEVIACVGSAMRLILDDSSFPAALPSSVGARHRLCTAVASEVKKLGFTGECGYNQLLYPSEADTRKLFMFLVDKIPKVEDDAADAGEENLGAGAMLNRRMKQSIQKWSQKCWVPPIVGGSRGCSWQDRGYKLKTCSVDLAEEKVAVMGRTAKKNPARAAYRQGRLRLVTTQAKTWRHLGPSLLKESFIQVTEAREREEEWNRAGVDNMSEFRKAKRRALDGMLRGAFSSFMKTSEEKDDFTTLGSLNDILNSLEGAGEGKGGSTALSRDAAFGQESAVDTEAERIAAGEGGEGGGSAKETEEEMLKKHQEAIDELQRKLDALKSEVEDGKRNKGMSTARALQVKSELAALLSRGSELERSYLVKKKVLEMLPDAATNIQKLQEICGGSAKRLVKLAAEWENHRRPLIEAQRAHKDAIGKRRELCREKVDDMKKMREEMKTMAQQLRMQEDRAKMLHKDYGKISKTINRTLYTYRILDIIKQVRKQKSEISRVIEDVHTVQKDINTLSERLKRAEAIADDLVFSSTERARNDPACVASYRLLTNLRQRFEDLIEIGRSTGKAETEARDIETRAEQLASRVSSKNVERIVKDLKQVKTENKQLAKKLAAK